MSTPPAVVTLGETMLRFTPKGLDRIEQVRDLEIHVGGSESNTSVGLARLGHQVAWVSRMTENPVGRLIANTIAAQGVDVSQVVWTDEDRVGTFYMERGRPPRNSQVYYDRAHSAMSHMRPDDLAKDLFASNSAGIFHTTGITLGISEDARITAQRAVELAKLAGWSVSFDVNYRSLLWTAEEAGRVCQSMAEQADLLFTPLRDIGPILGVEVGDRDQILTAIHDRFKQTTVVVTLGAEGAMAVTADGAKYYQEAFQTEEVERLGGGDAFSAGFLSGIIRGDGIAESLRWGAAAAAIKYTIPGDLPLFDRRVVEELVESGSISGIRR